MKFLKWLLAAAVLAGVAGCKESRDVQHTFQIKDGHFVYDGEPALIRSGEMHYPRIPHQYWRHRMQMLRAMGLNAVATYVFWNIHEPQEGVWDFEGDKNLAEYIRIAGEEGLMVILRPGPYVCAEWDFGGYPWWLQNIEGLELRRDNAPFLNCTRKYLDKLFEEVGDLQITRGGPIVMVQVENEFGSYAAQREDIPLEEHRAYNKKIYEQLKEVGFDIPMFTSDGSWLFAGGSIEGALPTANGEEDVANLKAKVDAFHGGEGPYMVAEFYSGWLMHWAEPFPRVEATWLARKTEEFLKNDVSFNYFMAHGGTNFGFTAGANYNREHDIQPDLTSYDYDAPISEAGWATPKFDSIRTVIQKYVRKPLPKVPGRIEVIEFPPVKLQRMADLLSVAHKLPSVSATQPKSFEELNQGYGYVLYSRKFVHPAKGELKIAGLRDFATVYIEGKWQGELNRYYQRYTMPVDIPFNSRLDLLVENMGRINYGAEIVRNTKGIISPVAIGGHEISGGWVMYCLPMETQPDFLSFDTADVYPVDEASYMKLAGRPLLYEGTFTLEKRGDTFLDMSDWGKGIIFVNGYNLGRFWNVGPQQTLYLPGVWLNEGENTIVVLEQMPQSLATEVVSCQTPILDKLRGN